MPAAWSKIPSLVIAMILPFAASSYAESKPDWSQYIEKGPSRPLLKSSSAKTTREPKAKPTRGRPGKKAAAATRAKARVKGKAKR